MFEVKEEDLSGDQTRALLRLHLAGMYASSPAGSVFALDLTGLQGTGVTGWTAWQGERIASIAAARRHGAQRLSFETGSGPAFEPALKLYQPRGFVKGAPFGSYVPGAFNQFLHLELR